MDSHTVPARPECAISFLVGSISVETEHFRRASAPPGGRCRGPTIPARAPDGQNLKTCLTVHGLRGKMKVKAHFFVGRGDGR